MSTEIVATSDNIKNITSMLTKLETVKDDSSKLREISLDNTGWEGMDASSFNTALNNFTKELDKTTDDIADALNVYLKKQEEQLAKGNESAKTAENLDILGIVSPAAIGFGIAGLPGAIVGGAGGYIASHSKEIGEFLNNTAKETSNIRATQIRRNVRNSMRPPRRNN